MSTDEQDVRRHLHGSLDAINVHGSRLQDIRAVATTRRRRRTAVTSAAAACAVVAGAVFAIQTPWAADGSDRLRPVQPVSPGPSTSTPRPTQSPAVKTGPVSATAARAAWVVFLRQHPRTVHSNVVVVDRTPWAAYADGSTVHVLTYDGAWRANSTALVPEGQPAVELALAQLTGSHTPDIVVSASGADVYWTSILSRTTSRWAADSFLGCGGSTCARQRVTRQADGAVSHGHFTSSYNPCDPSCVESVPFTLTWRWDTSTRTFVEVSRAQPPAHMTIVLSRQSARGSRDAIVQAEISAVIPQVYTSPDGKPIAAADTEVNGTLVDWGDGSTGGSDGGAIECHKDAKLIPLSMTFSETHRYTKPGTYTVRFSANACAPVGTVSKSITLVVR
jgi:hypothetical protein